MIPDRVREDLSECHRGDSVKDQLCWEIHLHSRR